MGISELDERFLPWGPERGPYITKLLVGSGRDFVYRWAKGYSRAMSPFPLEAEDLYYRRTRRAELMKTLKFQHPEARLHVISERVAIGIREWLGQDCYLWLEDPSNIVTGWKCMQVWSKEDNEASDSWDEKHPVNDPSHPYMRGLPSKT